jgi:hypothetical protein
MGRLGDIGVRKSFSTAPLILQPNPVRSVNMEQNTGKSKVKSKVKSYGKYNGN